MSQMLIKILNAKGYEKDSGEPLNCYWDGWYKIDIIQKRNKALLLIAITNSLEGLNVFSLENAKELPLFLV